MAHRIIIYDDFGNEIGEYYPEHEVGGGGRQAPTVGVDLTAMAAAIAQDLGDKDAEAVTATFKAKK